MKQLFPLDSKVIAENEDAARKAYERGDYIACLLIIHALIEALLRTFLDGNEKKRFSDLVGEYKRFLEKERQTEPVFVDELIQFNRRRNRTIHNLWEKGYVEINRKLEPVCRTAFIMYGLFIEWLQTFNDNIAEAGFNYDK